MTSILHFQFIQYKKLPLIAFCCFQKVLAAHGAAKVSAYVTHGVFPKGSWERFTLKNDGNYVLTNSLFLLNLYDLVFLLPFDASFRKL